MKRGLLVVLWMAITIAANAHKRTASDLKQAAAAFDRMLEQKDTGGLRRVLSERLQYGHSNGWMETKEDVIADLYNGKLSYKSITQSGKEPQVVIEGNTGIVRAEVLIEVLYDGKPVSMKLSVMQVWIYSMGGWRLLGRQSTKV